MESSGHFLLLDEKKAEKDGRKGGSSKILKHELP